MSPTSPNHVCRLRKLLYGLRQASRQWYARLAATLQLKGYTSSLNDYSLFFKYNGNLIFIPDVYVDDKLVTENDTQNYTVSRYFLTQNSKLKIWVPYITSWVWKSFKNLKVLSFPNAGSPLTSYQNSNVTICLRFHLLWTLLLN